MRREHVFLGQQLDDVGQRLEQSVRSNAPGSDAELDMREYFALDPLNVGQRREQYEGHQGGFDETNYKEVHLEEGAPYSAPGDSITSLRILEYLVSEPEVNSVSPEDWIRPGSAATRPLRGAVVAAPRSRTTFEIS